MCGDDYVLYIARSAITLPRTRALWPFARILHFYFKMKIVSFTFCESTVNQRIQVCVSHSPCVCAYPLCGAPITRINSLNSFNMLLLRTFVKIPYHRVSGFFFARILFLVLCENCLLFPLSMKFHYCACAPPNETLKRQFIHLWNSL